MKIAITATGSELSSEVDPRFGRAAYFLIIETDTGEFEAIDNSTNVTAGSGAGIKSSQTVINKGVEWVLTGNVGPNAYQALNAAGIKIGTDASGKVSDALEDFKNGKFQSTIGPTAPNKGGLQ